MDLAIHDKKTLIIIVVLAIFLLVSSFVLIPILSGKESKITAELKAAEEKAATLESTNVTVEGLKLGSTTKKETIAQKTEELHQKQVELGIADVKRYLETNNTNIFYLFSNIVDTLNVNVSELSIDNAEIYIEMNEEELAEYQKQKEEEEAKRLEEEEKAKAEGKELPKEPVQAKDKNGNLVFDAAGNPLDENGKVIPKKIPEGYKPKQVKQVSISMYGNYIDMMLYFQMLHRMTNNFELVSFDVAPMVLADGTPAEDYALATNEYDFVLGNTMKDMKPLDIFYYEERLKENERILAERARELEEELKYEETELKDNLDSLSTSYSTSETEVIQMARYYGRKYNVPVDVILAVIHQESGFEASAVNINENGTKDRGLMQINSNTVQQLMKLLGLEYIEGIEHIPALNIELGTLYLRSIADSRGYNFTSSKLSDQHYVLSAYNRGISGLESYAATNTNYSVTPYETPYSKSVIALRSNYQTLKVTGDIEVFDYNTEMDDYKAAYFELMSNNFEVEDVEFEPLKEYKEVTSVKAVFNVIEEGPDTLLLEDTELNFYKLNTKESPMSGSNLLMSDTSNIGNNTNGYSEKDLKNAAFREAEVKRTKEVITNRIANGLNIDAQLKYLKTLTLYNMDI